MKTKKCKSKTKVKKITLMSKVALDLLSALHHRRILNVCLVSVLILRRANAAE